eukprot:598565-Pyramimonas_sp.AAC.1
MSAPCQRHVSVMSASCQCHVSARPCRCEDRRIEPQHLKSPPPVTSDDACPDCTPPMHAPHSSQSTDLRTAGRFERNRSQLSHPRTYDGGDREAAGSGHKVRELNPLVVERLVILSSKGLTCVRSPTNLSLISSSKPRSRLSASHVA